MEHAFQVNEGIMNRVVTLQRVADRRLTQVDAGIELGLTERQVRRLLKQYRISGWAALLPISQSGNRRFSDTFKIQVMDLVRSHYIDFGPTFASEKLFELHDLHVSRETLRSWMMEAGLWKGRSRKKARVHQSRERRSRFGELVQIDGSPHDWFEGRGPRCCLIVMIDDATSKIIIMRFEPSETAFGYMKCLEAHLKKCGRPVSYYSDKHSIFRTSRPNSIDGKYEKTQFHRALNELSIELICANSPQAKGRVERANGILQDRLIKEMRLRRISTIDAANEYLEEFIEKYNSKFGVEPLDPEDAHRPINKTEQELDWILCRREVRSITKNLEVSYEGKTLQIQGVGHGYRLRHAKVIVCESPAGEIRIIYKEKALVYKVLGKTQAPQVVDSKDVNLVVDQIIALSCYPQGPQAQSP